MRTRAHVFLVGVASCYHGTHEGLEPNAGFIETLRRCQAYSGYSFFLSGSDALAAFLLFLLLPPFLVLDSFFLSASSSFF